MFCFIVAVKQANESLVSKRNVGAAQYKYYHLDRIPADGHNDMFSEVEFPSTMPCSFLPMLWCCLGLLAV